MSPAGGTSSDTGRGYDLLKYAIITVIAAGVGVIAGTTWAHRMEKPEVVVDAEALRIVLPEAVEEQLREAGIESPDHQWLVSVENRSDRPAEGVSVKFPVKVSGYYTRDTGEITKFGEAKAVDVGELLPDRDVSIVAWRHGALPPLAGDGVRVGHKRGEGKTVEELEEEKDTYYSQLIAFGGLAFLMCSSYDLI